MPNLPSSKSMCPFFVFCWFTKVISSCYIAPGKTKHIHIPTSKKEHSCTKSQVMYTYIWLFTNVTIPDPDHWKFFCTLIYKRAKVVDVWPMMGKHICIWVSAISIVIGYFPQEVCFDSALIKEMMKVLWYNKMASQNCNNEKRKLVRVVCHMYIRYCNYLPQKCTFFLNQMWNHQKLA